ncbi:MAG: type I-B CRISPR-associated protein Cas5b [Bacteroidetes bacterium]|nr:type I-B CRISPR-associated protein Cas5b [Bacteroidota bacterium]
METKLISVDLRAQFGFLKKPDTNEGIYLTYNCLHKPALLGILGAIVGLGGYAQAYSVNKDLLPEYYQKLKSLKVGIQPLESAKGNYQKTVISYNNSVGYANLDGGTLIVQEQTLLRPSYRIFLLLNTNDEIQHQLYQNLLMNESAFIPYLGKNDFQLWWDGFREYEYEANFIPKESYQVETLFLKKKPIKDWRDKSSSAWFRLENGFIYFENLPAEFDEEIKHYRMKSFAYSDGKIMRGYELEDLFLLKPDGLIVQLL